MSDVFVSWSLYWTLVELQSSAVAAVVSAAVVLFFIVKTWRAVVNDKIAFFMLYFPLVYGGVYGALYVLAWCTHSTGLYSLLIDVNFVVLGILFFVALFLLVFGGVAGVGAIGSGVYLAASVALVSGYLVKVDCVLGIVPVVVVGVLLFVVFKLNKWAENEWEEKRRDKKLFVVEK